MKLSQRKYQEEIIHLDLPFHKWKYASTSPYNSKKYGDWCYGWPEQYESNAHRVRKKMRAMIKSRLAHHQDLHLPITLFTSAYTHADRQRNLMYDAVSDDKYLSITKKLLKVGVNPNVVCYHNSFWQERPLESALINGALKTAQLLLKTPGIDVHVKNNVHGRSLLHCARVGFKSSDQRFFITKLLLDAGVDPNSRDEQGQTELFNLASEGEDARSIIMLMCYYDLRADIKDYNRRTAIEHAKHWHAINNCNAIERGEAVHCMPKAVDIIRSEYPYMIMAAELKKDPMLYFNLLPESILMNVVQMHLK